VAQSKLVEHFRRGGMTEVVLIRDYPPVGLADLVADATLIAQVVIIGARSYEENRGPGQGEIMTAFRADVQDIYLQRGKPLLPGAIITIRQDGGTLIVDGKPLTAADSQFPAFTVGEEYVLFLRPDRAGDGFIVWYGGQGAFRVDADRVARRVTHYPGDTPDERPILDRPIDAFRQLVVDEAARLR
jgi:hypothetical protein